MKVTISIINFNYGRYLKQAIESALIQYVPEVSIEVLVIDDGSTDESDSIIATYSNHGNFRVSKTENRGFAASLTRAVVEAEGEYIFFLDADDYFAPDKIAKMLPFLLQEGYLYVSDTSSYINQIGHRIHGGASGSTSTVAINKQASLPLLPVENELYFFSLYKIDRGISLNESYTYYRFHNNNMTDRRAPGKWNTYLSGMSHNLFERLMGIATDDQVLIWNVDPQIIIHAAYEFKSQSYYNKLEAALECRQVKSAYKSCLLMLYWNFKAHKPILLHHFKMIGKTFLLRPSFKK